MNNETYEALKRVIRDLKAVQEYDKDIKIVESWIDEVAKEYED